MIVLGSVEQLRCTRALGCPWDARACAETAVVGLLDVLQYTHANVRGHPQRVKGSTDPPLMPVPKREHIQSMAFAPDRRPHQNNTHEDDAATRYGRLTRTTKIATWNTDCDGE